MSAMAGASPFRAGSLMDQLAKIGVMKGQSFAQFNSEVVPGFLRDVQSDLQDDGQINASWVQRAFASAGPQAIQKNAMEYLEVVQTDLGDDRQLNGSVFNTAFFYERLNGEYAGFVSAQQNPNNFIGRFGMNPRLIGTRELFNFAGFVDQNLDTLITPQEVAFAQQSLNDRINLVQQFGGYLPAGVAQSRLAYYSRMQQLMGFVSANYNTMSAFDGMAGLGRNDFILIRQRFGEYLQG